MQYSGAYNAANMAYAVQAITGPTGAPVCLILQLKQGTVYLSICLVLMPLLKRLLHMLRQQLPSKVKTKEVAAFNVTGDFNLLGLDASFAAGVERREEKSG